jgi:hypothetical protein
VADTWIKIFYNYYQVFGFWVDMPDVGASPYGVVQVEVTEEYLLIGSIFVGVGHRPMWLIGCTTSVVSRWPSCSIHQMRAITKCARSPLHKHYENEAIEPRTIVNIMR